MTQPHVGSYDDAPEVEVSTVLEVPLLWRSTGGPGAPADAAPESAVSRRSHRRGAHRREGRVSAEPAVARRVAKRPAGRHRAPATAPALVPPVPVESTAVKVMAPTNRPSTSGQASASTGRAELAHTLRVGAVSAAIVLALFVAVLLGLATWLP